MAHYKRGRGTSRKEGKRIDTKRVRAAEAQALNGGKARSVHRDSSWTTIAPPLLDGIKHPSKKKGRKKPKRYSGCPGRPRKAHQFLTDTRTVRKDRYNWRDDKYEYYFEEEEYRLCVHCPREEVKSRWYGWRKITPRFKFKGYWM